MQILRGLDQFRTFLEEVDCSQGCLADTGFLYGMAYKDDHYYPQSLEVSIILEEKNMPIHTNVIGRMEFVDLVFQKMLTRGAVSLYKSMDPHTQYQDLFNHVKWIRDREAADMRKRKSFKIGDHGIKELRKKIISATGSMGWKAFCAKYAGSVLSSEWLSLEKEFGLSFIEALEGETSDIVTTPLNWSDMVGTMGLYGVRGTDAMILNLFRSCSLNILITSDIDFKFDEIDDPALDKKGVLILQNSQPDAEYLLEVDQELSN